MTKNLGIPKSESNPLISPAMLYSFNRNHGLWVPTDKLTHRASSSSGYEVIADTKAEFPSEYPIVASINELLPRRRVCQVSDSYM